MSGWLLFFILFSCWFLGDVGCATGIVVAATVGVALAVAVGASFNVTVAVSVFVAVFLAVVVAISVGLFADELDCRANFVAVGSFQFAEQLF